MTAAELRYKVYYLIQKKKKKQKKRCNEKGKLKVTAAGGTHSPTGSSDQYFAIFCHCVSESPALFIASHIIACNHTRWRNLGAKSAGLPSVVSERARHLHVSALTLRHARPAVARARAVLWESQKSAAALQRLTDCLHPPLAASSCSCCAARADSDPTRARGERAMTFQLRLCGRPCRRLELRYSL